MSEERNKVENGEPENDNEGTLDLGAQNNLTEYVNKLVADLQERFSTMSNNIIGRLT